MMIFCRKHKKFEKVVGFQHDNPVLECGMIKSRTKRDDEVDQCRQAIERYVNLRALAVGCNPEEARNELVSLLGT